MSTSHGKIILKFVVISVALARSGIALPIGREITRINKGIRRYNFRIKSGKCKTANTYCLTFSRYELSQLCDGLAGTKRIFTDCIRQIS